MFTSIIFKTAIESLPVMAKKQATEENEPFGRRLARLRRERAMTQAELAEKIGITRRMVIYYECESDRPPAHVIDRLSKVLKVSADALLGIRTITGDAPINFRIWRRFRIIEDLSAADRMAVWKFVQALVQKPKMKKQRKVG